MDKLKEDTVSADRKERIIFDPEAWRKSDKSGRKTSAITSRQNFDNEKFTRKKEQEKVDEAAVTKIKTNSPQIEFVTGTDKPKEQAVGNQQNLGIKKIAEGLLKKAVTQVSEGRMKDKATDADFHPQTTGKETPPFDGPYTKTPSTVVDKSGARHTPMSRVRDLARQALKKQVKEEIQQIDELSKDTLNSYVSAAQKDNKDNADSRRSGDAAEAKWAKDRMVKRSTGIGAAKNRLNKEEVELEEGVRGFDPEQFGSDGSGAGGAGAGDIGKTDKKKKVVKKEETDMSKTYADFIQQLQEYNAGKDGVYRHKGTYGGSYDSNDDEDDETPKKPAAPAVKRGRGRPAGSKSGANQKVTQGKSYGGIATHTLSLPNSK